MNTTTDPQELFSCPKCLGLRFNVKMDGTLGCANRLTIGGEQETWCGWRGKMSDNLLKPATDQEPQIITEPEPLPELGSYKTTTPEEPADAFPTAAQSREATERVIRKECQAELTKIAEAIKESRSQGATWLKLDGPVNSAGVWFLKKLGYEIGGNSDHTYIFW